MGNLRKLARRPARSQTYCGLTGSECWRYDHGGRNGAPQSARQRQHAHAVHRQTRVFCGQAGKGARARARERGTVATREWLRGGERRGKAGS